MTLGSRPLALYQDDVTYADWRSFRVFNLKLRPILRLTDHLTAESRSVAHAFVTVVSNLKSREPLWFGGERKKETLDEFFRTQLSRKQRHGIEAACLDMWEPYRLSLAQWTPACRLVYEKFHLLQHANAALDEVRRAEFFRQGGRMRGLAKGNRWLLDTMENWTCRKPTKHPPSLYSRGARAETARV